jgi:hypothetical protein
MESEREQSHLSDLDNSGEAGGAKAKKAVVEESAKSRREDVAEGGIGPLSLHCTCTSSTAVQLETFHMFVSGCTCISISFYY